MSSAHKIICTAAVPETGFWNAGQGICEANKSFKETAAAFLPEGSVDGGVATLESIVAGKDPTQAASAMMCENVAVMLNPEFDERDVCK
ncbi:hypothetical protein E4U19_007944 [Claviceps sp. Clav32 group G5]|nr:hypothetical protein E4U19_007944 [Claviceps sp. Clav32 group G5]